MTEIYDTIQAVVASQGNKIFSIEFIKKNGDYRKMLVQAAVLPKHLKGDEASESAQRAVATRRENFPNLLNIWCMDHNACRSVNMDTVLRISGSGTVLFEVADAGDRIYQAKHHGDTKETVNFVRSSGDVA